MLAAEPAQNQREWVLNRLEDYGHDNRIGLLTGSLIPGAAYLKAQKLRSMLRQQVHETLEQYDVLVCPTAGRPAVPRQDDPVITSKEMAGRLPYMRTNTFNLSSSPAVSVHCGFNSGSLPIGLQVAGRPGGDATVLKVGPRLRAGHLLAHHAPAPRLTVPRPIESKKSPSPNRGRACNEDHPYFNPTSFFAKKAPSAPLLAAGVGR